MEIHHLGEIVFKQASKYKNRTEIKYQTEEGKWRNMSWTELADKVLKAARAMAELGIVPGDNIGIYSQNMEKYLITDFAAFANRAVMVPIYATASPSQVAYITHDAGIKIVFVGEQFQYNNAYKVQRDAGII
jgi:long-chain acyl-CoA synthetase